MTEKLYYTDSYMNVFEAKVMSCNEAAKGYEIVLDKTVFYPEGGGQPADNGSLEEAVVKDVKIKDNTIYHLVDRPLEVGRIVKGIINFNRRFDMMQQHSGEHIISGIINSKYGYNNVGFHLNDTHMTADVDGELTLEQIKEVERIANEAVYKNIEVEINTYNNEQVKELIYRSKIELKEDVRLVKVPGYDSCACCGTHVKKTGEIGIIKIVDSAKHRGGTRLTVLCGNRALKDYGMKQEVINKVVGILSASPDKISQQIERLQKEIAENKEKQRILIDEIINDKIAGYLKDNKKIYIVCEDVIGAEDIKRMCSSMIDKTNKTCIVVYKDIDKLRYVIGNKSEDIRGLCKELNSKFNGKGGGNEEMCQGSLQAELEDIKKYVEENYK